MAVLIFFLLFSGNLAFGQAIGQSLPEWFLPLREAIYEQNLNSQEITSLYQNISNRARTSLSGAELYIILSRCEYLMGRAYQYEEKKEQAAFHYGE